MNYLRRLGADFNPQVVVVSLMTLVIMMGSIVISPVLPLIAQEFGVSYVGAGALVSAFALGRIPFDFIGGAMVDRFNPRWIAAGGAAVVALSAGLSFAVALMSLRWVGEFTPTPTQARVTTTSAGTPSVLRQLSHDFTPNPRITDKGERPRG